MLESGCLEESNLGRYGAPSVIKTNARLERGRLFKENQILGGQCARERERESMCIKIKHHVDNMPSQA